jgi:hypothetical protein
MKSSMLVCTTVGLACFALTACSPPLTQTGVRPGLYAFHTGQTPACPGLDWHVTIEQDNEVNGFVAWNQGQHIARLAGTISPGRKLPDPGHLGWRRRQKSQRFWPGGRHQHQHFHQWGRHCV